MEILPTFSSDRETLYSELTQQVKSLTEAEPDWLPNLANTAALVAYALDRISWCGFYLVRGQELVLGPFWGKPACIRIPFGRGVCGSAFSQASPLLVPDVSQFPGHIACDPESQSEVVLPVIQNGRRLGVLDLDSPDLHRFTSEDVRGLAAVVDALVRTCDLSGAVGGSFIA